MADRDSAPKERDARRLITKPSVFSGNGSEDFLDDVSVNSVSVAIAEWFDQKQSQKVVPSLRQNVLPKD